MAWESAETSAWPGKSASSLQTVGEVKSGAVVRVVVGVLEVVVGVSVATHEAQLVTETQTDWPPDPLHC